MRRIVGVYSGITYTENEYLNDTIKECRLLVPNNVGDKELSGYISNHRIACQSCTGCPVKQLGIRKGA